MIRLTRFLVLWILFICCTEIVFGQTASQGNIYAIVVGITKYQNPRLSTLQFADRDASLFAEHLQSKAGGNLPVTNVKLLLNEQATIAAIYDALNWLKTRCTENDKAYFYFSGHGDVETENSFSKGYLLAYNSPTTNYRNNAITIEDLNEMASHLSLKNNATVVLVTDACHSGQLAGDYYKGRQLVASQLKLILNNQVRLAACGVDELAAEGTDWGEGRGVFSYYLLKGLNGMADLNRNDTIQLRELNRYLDSCFAEDRVLISNAHKQHPVLNGNPNETLVLVNKSMPPLISLAPQPEKGSQRASVLKIFKPLSVQPVDYLFRLMQLKSVEDKIPFSTYDNIPAESIPITIVNACIAYQKRLTRQADSLISIGEKLKGNYWFADVDSLQLLKNQLLRSNSAVNSFNERFIQVVHGLAQEMVNAYLEGDVAELEKRQYYYAGNRQYRDFVSMLRVALQLAPRDHYLHNLLAVQEAYISGLVLRMEMVTSKDVPELFKRALKFQQKAVKLEPYAAFIHNELGNLYLRSKKYRSAARHLDMAKELSPAWAIPWSNQIRLGLATRNFRKATDAIAVADSLQDDLSYTAMNAGLAMEQQGNLFEAQRYYHKAIKNNEIHFLPYERLGDIYTKTGEYQKADWFLAAAHMRRKDFAITTNFLKLGVEAIEKATAAQDGGTCDLFKKILPKPLEPYVEMLKAFGMVEADPESALQILNAVSKKVGQIPLLYHYWGKALYAQKMWKDAEPMLLNAGQGYKTDSALSVYLIDNLKTRHNADSCLLGQLMRYNYDLTEDHYMLGSIYEKMGDTDKALLQYETISALENKRQNDQAAFRGYYELPVEGNKKKSVELIKGKYIRDALTRSDQPVMMGGYLKLGELYEMAGDYAKAESMYLRQVQLNRQAGNLRNVQPLRSLRELEDKVNLSKYWIAVNRQAEAKTFDFYQKMLQLFPRDNEWQQKAGMFLFNRLTIAFQKLNPAEYEDAYEAIKVNAYPFATYNSADMEREIQLKLPGSGQIIVIPLPKYDPLLIALESLQLSVKLSGDLIPNPKTMEAIADLTSWMGRQKEAFVAYKQLIRQNEPDPKLRSKIISYCFAIYEGTFAMQQLEILYKLGQTSHQQNIQLARCFILSGLPEKGRSILSNANEQDKTQKHESAKVTALSNALHGRYTQALINMESVVIDTIGISQDSINTILAGRYYFMARINALSKQNEQALSNLKLALQKDFSCGYVLDNDSAWNHLRETDQWNTLRKKFSQKLYAKDYKSREIPDSSSILKKLMGN
ncbi:caspase family protein [Dyadobacter psychrotolerans]|uniref:Peptidase C14 caspase domain-containing protein n=1 Tax=Dyadobacter psychrotolerans TaxID=2541721 RepID=A0A4R5DWY6_9BACT|nr:caspase family protein [Dyadobacter psychrotolerans]TDE15573.1 hypothetical protein E0F88_13805 [Dyadobacter psychrotolerans]